MTHAERDRQWRKDNPGKNREYCRKTVARNKALIIIVKKAPCSDCGKVYHHTVMDLDHVRGQKKFRLAAVKHVSLETLEEEINKCDVVCSNCHRIRTWNRAHSNDQIL